MLHFNGNHIEPIYQAPRYDNMYEGPPYEENLSNYEYLLPRPEYTNVGTPSGRDPNNVAKFEDLYQLPQTPTGGQALSRSPNNSVHSHEGTPSSKAKAHVSEESKADVPNHRKTNSKLPMHLSSSVTFDYPDKGEQFYRKNQQPSPSMVGPNGEYKSNVNPRIKEDAQKAYFSSHLEGVFKWDQNNSTPKGQQVQQPPPGYPQHQPQYPQGSQYNQEHIIAKDITGSIPPTSQMNTQQKHTQIMKLENSLLTFQMEKDRLTAELEKIPESHRQSHGKKQRKDELQSEIELLEKNINTVKLKLRDIRS